MAMMDGALDPALPILRRWADSEPSYIWRETGERVSETKMVARLNALGVAPAWQPAVFAKSGRAKIQARAIDGSGKEQIIYAAWFRQRQEERKFDALADFGAVLPAIRRNANDILKPDHGAYPFDQALAACTLLIDDTAMRVGTRRFRKENGTVGAVGLQRRHIADFSTKSATLVFKAKGGATRQVFTRHSRVLAYLIGQTGQGGDLFQGRDQAGRLRRVDQSDIVNFCLRVANLDGAQGNGVTPKAFRLWHGSLAALNVRLQSTDTPSIKMMAQAAATRLGNTPAIARTSYIHPVVLNTDQTISDFTDAAARPYLSQTEAVLLALLQRHKKAPLAG